MSYSETYTQKVFYSGTVRYPASENGGYASYSGSIPVSVNLFVDTTPFDSSVSGCASTVNVLTGSVVAMNAAQVHSINESAREISSHITNGFFNMISSEISQEMKILFNKFCSVYELMKNRAQTLEKQMAILGDDYRRTSERYIRIFNDLDQELKKRIVALDKNAYEISRKIQREQLQENYSKQVSKIVIGVNEDEIINQQLLIANINHNSSKVMKDLSDNVMEGLEFSKTVNSMLGKDKCLQNQIQYVPVMFMEMDNFVEANRKMCCTFSSESGGSFNADMEKNVQNYFSGQESNWHDFDKKEKASIDAAFKSLAEKELSSQDEKSRRIYDMIMKLKNQNETLTV